jgi:protein SCO1/2
MTGTTEEIAEAAKAYRVYFSTSQYDEQDPNGDYLVDHSIFIYLMGPDGQLLEYFGQNRTAEEMRALTLSHLTAA